MQPSKATKRGTQTLAELGEQGLLRLIKQRWSGAASGVVLGIGDDAALLAAVGPEAVLTTDMLVEGVDFAWEWASPRDVGHKAAAVNLSDLAAMGARPRALLAAMAMPRDFPAASATALLSSLARVGARWGAPLVGGDLSATRGPVVISVTAVGQVAAGRALRRYRAGAGDVVLCSGTLGAAAAGLACLRRGAGVWRRPTLIKRQLRPQPRLRLGQCLADSGLVVAAADISDGLLRDALHLVRPGCGVQLDAAQLPLARGVAPVAELLGQQPWELALAGGEDFELVLAVRATHVAQVCAVARRIAATTLRVVGRVVEQPGVQVLHAPGWQRRRAFEHFSS